MAYVDQFKSPKEFIEITCNQAAIGFGMQGIMVSCDSAIDQFSDNIPSIGTILIVGNCLYRLFRLKDGKKIEKEILNTVARITIVGAMIMLFPMEGLNVFLGSFCAGLAERSINTFY